MNLLLDLVVGAGKLRTVGCVYSTALWDGWELFRIEHWPGHPEAHLLTSAPIKGVGIVGFLYHHHKHQSESPHSCCDQSLWPVASLYHRHKLQSESPGDTHSSRGGRSVNTRGGCQYAEPSDAQHQSWASSIRWAGSVQARHRSFFQHQLPPHKTNMIMEKQPFEDVSLEYGSIMICSGGGIQSPSGQVGLMIPNVIPSS